MSDETAESRLAKTLFVVQATSFETLCLWSENARQWEQVYPAWLVTVGELDSRPICVSMSWARIDGHLVMFWEATSAVVDTVQIEKWLSQHFAGKWDSGTRQATTDAMNFHQCLNAIDDANKLS